MVKYIEVSQGMSSPPTKLYGRRRRIFGPQPVTAPVPMPAPAIWQAFCLFAMHAARHGR